MAAADALASRRVRRVAVVDWDVHHGNGTQHIFDAEPRVLFTSLHRFGSCFFPGSGALGEVGEGEGRGRTLNVPWQQTGLGDTDYAAAFELVLMPVLRAFSEGEAADAISKGEGDVISKGEGDVTSRGEGDVTSGGDAGDVTCGGDAADDGPTLLLVSAGFDAALGDLQGGMSLSAGGSACMIPTPTLAPTQPPTPTQTPNPTPTLFPTPTLTRRLRVDDASAPHAAALPSGGSL